MKSIQSRIRELETATRTAWGLVVVNQGENIEAAIAREGKVSHPGPFVIIPAKDGQYVGAAA